jgi:hypothetical protein
LQPDPVRQAQPDHSLTPNVRSNTDYYICWSCFALDTSGEWVGAVGAGSAFRLEGAWIQTWRVPCRSARPRVGMFQRRPQVSPVQPFPMATRADGGGHEPHPARGLVRWHAARTNAAIRIHQAHDASDQRIMNSPAVSFSEQVHKADARRASDIAATKLDPGS